MIHGCPEQNKTICEEFGQSCQWTIPTYYNATMHQFVWDYSSNATCFLNDLYHGLRVDNERVMFIHEGSSYSAYDCINLDRSSFVYLCFCCFFFVFVVFVCLLCFLNLPTKSQQINKQGNKKKQKIKIFLTHIIYINRFNC